MKRISFNNRYGLTDAVRTYQKTMKRMRVRLPQGTDPDSLCPVKAIDDKGCVYYESGDIKLYPHYQPGEEVAVTGISNRICITSVKLEQLADITDNDCRKEGVVPIKWKQWLKPQENTFKQEYKIWDVWTLPKFREEISDDWGNESPECYMAASPKAAFYVLVRRLWGKKTWHSNPWVWVYEFVITSKKTTSKKKN